MNGGGRRGGWGVSFITFFVRSCLFFLSFHPLSFCLTLEYNEHFVSDFKIKMRAHTIGKRNKYYEVYYVTGGWVGGGGLLEGIHY